MQRSFLYLSHALDSNSVRKVRWACVCGRVPKHLQILPSGLPPPAEVGLNKKKVHLPSLQYIKLTSFCCSLKWGVDSSFTGGRVVGSLNLPSRGIFTSSLHQTLEKPIPLSKALGLSCPILSSPGHPPISSSDSEPKQRCGAPGTSPHSAWPQNCGWYHFSEESWTAAHLLLWKLYPFLHTQDSTMKTSGNVSGTRSLRTWVICCYFEPLL